MTVVRNDLIILLELNCNDHYCYFYYYCCHCCCYCCCYYYFLSTSTNNYNNDNNNNNNDNDDDNNDDNKSNDDNDDNKTFKKNCRRKNNSGNNVIDVPSPARRTRGRRTVLTIMMMMRILSRPNLSHSASSNNTTDLISIFTFSTCCYKLPTTENFLWNRSPVGLDHCELFCGKWLWRMNILWLTEREEVVTGRS